MFSFVLLNCRFTDCYNFNESDNVITSTTTNSITVKWRIPRFTTQEQYYIQYGSDSATLAQRTNPIPSISDTTLINQTYEFTVEGLDSGRIYSLRVVAVYNILARRQSEIVVNRTNEEGKQM